MRDFGGPLGTSILIAALALLPGCGGSTVQIDTTSASGAITGSGEIEGQSFKFEIVPAMKLAQLDRLHGVTLIYAPPADPQQLGTPARLGNALETHGISALPSDSAEIGSLTLIGEPLQIDGVAVSFGVQIDPREDVLKHFAGGHTMLDHRGDPVVVDSRTCVARHRVSCLEELRQMVKEIRDGFPEVIDQGLMRLALNQ